MGIKIKVKCFNCGTINDLDIEPVLTPGKIQINFVCQECGALNEVSVDPQDLTDTEQDWLCLPPRGFEWVLPSGKIDPIMGDPIYISAFGEYLSRKVYLERYKVDPEVAYQYMRRKRNSKTASKITNSLNQNVAGKRELDSSNIQKIEIICKYCKRVIELNL